MHELLLLIFLRVVQGGPLVSLFGWFFLFRRLHQVLVLRVRRLRAILKRVVALLLELDFLLLNELLRLFTLVVVRLLFLLRHRVPFCTRICEGSGLLLTIFTPLLAELRVEN